MFQLTALAVPHLIKTKGNIVNVSSVTGLRSFPNCLAYCMSKAAVDQFTRCIALELATKQVNNCFLYFRLILYYYIINIIFHIMFQYYFAL